MADEELIVEARFDDDYTQKAKAATAATHDMADGLNNTQAAAQAANVSFLATMKSLDGLKSGFDANIRGMSELGIIGEDTVMKMRQVSAALDIVTGSTKMAIAAKKMLATVNFTEVLPSLVAVGLAAASLAAAYLAVNSASKEQRIVFSALTGVTMGLAVAKFLLATAEISYKTALTAGVAAATIAAGITYAVASMNSAKQSAMDLPAAQTSEGEGRFVRRTGQAVVHEGEVISRADVSSPMAAHRHKTQPETTIILTGTHVVTDAIGLRALADTLGRHVTTRQTREVA